jgi:hypothetical protein
MMALQPGQRAFYFRSNTLGRMVWTDGVDAAIFVESMESSSVAVLQCCSWQAAAINKKHLIGRRQKIRFAGFSVKNRRQDAKSSTKAHNSPLLTADSFTKRASSERLTKTK